MTFTTEKNCSARKGGWQSARRLVGGIEKRREISAKGSSGIGGLWGREPDKENFKEGEKQANREEKGDRKKFQEKKVQCSKGGLRDDRWWGRGPPRDNGEFKKSGNLYAKGQQRKKRVDVEVLFSPGALGGRGKGGELMGKGVGGQGGL